MYNDEMRLSMEKVEANRKANVATEPRRMTAEEKEKLAKYTQMMEQVKERLGQLA